MKIFTQDFIQTLRTQLLRLVSGPLLLLILPMYLDKETQGYWFTFVSLAALAVFADLGFTAIISQWTAHEFAHLTFDKNNKFEGSVTNVNRISSLFVFSLKWVSIMVVVAFPIIFFVGYSLLSQKITEVDWIFPWLLYCLISVVIFMNNATLSFFEGCNSVGKIQKIRFNINAIASSVTITCIIFGLKLYALAIGLLASACLGSYLIYKNYSSAGKQMFFLPKEYHHSWKKELIPLLWRYAISWASGYFIFQLFTPLSFHYYGAVEAGKVGLSLTVLMAIYGLSSIWMVIIVPKLNIHIARGEYIELNILFKKHFKLSLMTYIGGIAVFFISLTFLGEMLKFSDRFADIYSLGIIATAWFLQVIINSWAVYIRGHKEEPLAIPSLIWAIYISLASWVIAAYFPFRYYFIGYISSYIFIIPWFYAIFKKYHSRSE